MKVVSLDICSTLAVLGLASYPVRAWLDNGHMLVAEVARQQLQAEEANALDSLMADWAKDFPVAGTLVSASTWMDHIKQLPPGLEAFSMWHFSDKPFNPDGLKLTELQEHGWKSNPSAVWSLVEAMRTLGASTSRFAFHLMLLVLVHVVGDLHQPLHAANGFFEDEKFGYLWNASAGGDLGGNRFGISTPWPRVRNLHVLWDAGGGLYMASAPLSEAQRRELEHNATQLISDMPRGTLPEYVAGQLDECWNAAVQISRQTPRVCRDVFVQWAKDVHALAGTEAYGHGIAPKDKVSAKYLAAVQAVSKRQIVLAGYRLADALKLASPRIPASTIKFPGPAPQSAPPLQLLVLMSCTCVAIGFLLALLRDRCRRGKFQKSPGLLEAEGSGGLPA